MDFKSEITAKEEIIELQEMRVSPIPSIRNRFGGISRYFIFSSFEILGRQNFENVLWENIQMIAKAYRSCHFSLSFLILYFAPVFLIFPWDFNSFLHFLVVPCALEYRSDKIFGKFEFEWDFSYFIWGSGWSRGIKGVELYWGN